jgi:Ca2+-transporting ATPase
LATRHTGLSQSQARELFERLGPNELPKGEQRTIARIILEVVEEPMLAMLLGAGAIYFLLGDKAEAAVLLVFALLSVLITVVQEARTENVLEALRDLAAPRALVIRDGETVRIAGREVVEGDVLVLEQGDRIAADALLLEASELEADESLLTGESVPVAKWASESDEGLVHSGTIVTRGRGLAKVTATGARSRIGQIGRSLETLETETPKLQSETSRIVTISAAGGVAVAGIVVLLYGLLRGSWLDALLAGIATAMSLLPEEFPVVLTIFLAMGARRIAQVGVLTRRTAAIETMGSATVLCADKTGTLTQNRMNIAELWVPGGQSRDLADWTNDPRAFEVLETSALASAPVPVDPMEIAFHAAARDAGSAPGSGRELVHSYGLSPELLAMSNIWRCAEGATPWTVAAKGAPEAIARLCGLDAASRLELEAAAEDMASRGMRVLGVASAEAAEGDHRKAHEDHAFRLLGLAGLADPLRAGVTEAIAQCHSAGIRVVMITGDHAATAKAIANQAGINATAVLLGQEVAALPEDELVRRVQQVSVFARTQPEQKLRIVQAMKQAGEIVAMTGDGVNDAPALKAAHIGIAMGKRGTDVAREAASIVLVEDEFGAIAGAIRLGRRIHDNIRKAFGFIVGVHIPIAGLAILPLPLGLPIILGPLQIALLEMVIDPVCALVFEAERDESRIMQRPPRRPDERLFSRILITRSVIQGSLAFVIVGAITLAAHSAGFGPEQLRVLVFLSLLACVLALIVTNRSFTGSVSQIRGAGNTAFRFVLGSIAAGVLCLTVSETAQRLLKFAAAGLIELAAASLAGLVLLVALELTKKYLQPEELAQ